MPYWLELELCLPCVMCESYEVPLRPAVDVFVVPYSYTAQQAHQQPV